MWGNNEALKFLLQHGASPTQVINEWSALDWAKSVCNTYAQNLLEPFFESKNKEEPSDTELLRVEKAVHSLCFEEKEWTNLSSCKSSAN